MSKFFKLFRLLLLFTFCFGLKTYAQYDIDSLGIIVDNPKVHDTVKLNTLALLIDNLYDIDSIETYSKKMYTIAQKNLKRNDLNKKQRNHYLLYLAAYYSNISFCYEQERNPKSLAYLNKSISLYEKANAKEEVYSSIVSKGLLLSRRKQYKEAIDCYFKALKYYEKNENKNLDGISYVYANLASIYEEQNQNKMAIFYLRKSLFYLNKKKTQPTLEDDLQKFIVLYNLGSVYIYEKKNELATVHLKNALLISKKHNHDSYTSMALGRLGLIDLYSDKLDEAEKKLLEANSISDSEISKIFTLVNLGEVYFKKKNYEKAEEYLKEGLALNQQLKKTDYDKQAYELLYKIYKETGRYKEALSIYEKLISINDEALKLQVKDELKQQELKYGYEKKVLNLELINERKNTTKNTQLIILGSLLLLLLIAGYFYYKNSKQKQKLSSYEKKELKQKLLLTQMNPHFIFNSIDNIQSLIHNKQEVEAVNYLTKFSKLTRQILENSNENYITLEEELAMMDNYLNIQQLLYNNKFEFNIAAAESLELENILVPPMLTQPFIENAIKHGLKNMLQKGQIKILLALENNKLLFTITDNGIGFQDNERDSTKKSMAMKITKERLKSISNKSDFEVHLSNLFDENKKIIGAKVYFEIPYIYEN